MDPKKINEKEKVKKMNLVRIIASFLIFLLLISPVYAKFSININMPIEYLSIHPGDNISFEVNVIKIGEEEKDDYEMSINILDKDNNRIAHKNKFIAIENEINTIVRLTAPSDIKPGEYKLEVVIGNDKSDVNFVVEKESLYNLNVIYFLVIIFAGFFIIFYLYDRKLNKLLKHIPKKVSMEDLVKRGKK